MNLSDELSLHLQETLCLVCKLQLPATHSPAKPQQLIRYRTPERCTVQASNESLVHHHPRLDALL